MSVLKLFTTFKALNSEKKLNKLLKNNIEISNVKKNDNKLSFSFETKNKEQIQALIGNENFNCDSYNGITKFFLFLKNRKGIVFGVFLFLCALIYSSNVLLNYKIEGLENLEQTQIVDTLKENGYNKFKQISAIDLNNIENILISNFENISFASAMVRGNTLIVNVKENEGKNVQKFEPLTAVCDGVVTKISVQQGTPLVKIGDVVKSGQMLVMPYENNNGVKISVVPKAQIYATTYIKGQVVYNSQGYIKGRTGETFTERNFSLFGLCVPCKSEGNKNILQGEYEVEQTCEIINFVYPITMMKTIYYKIGDIEKADYSRDAQNLNKESVYLAYEQLTENCEVLRESTQQIEVDGVYYITTYLEINKSLIKE